MFCEFEETMFTVLDKSNYLKGLLILARRDNKLVDAEKELIRNAAKRLGFSRDFYEDVLKSLLSNRYLKDDPVEFSNKQVAELFLNDGLELAMSDSEFHDREIKFLRAVAEKNSIGAETFNAMVQQYKELNKLS